MRNKWLAGLLVSGLLLAACGPAATATPVPKAQATNTPVPQPPIKLGVIFAATGPRAGVGGPERDAAVWAMRQVNAAGGVLGRKIELVIEDDQGQDVVTGPVAKKLLEQDKVVAIIGSTGLASSRVLSAAAEQSKVPACITMYWDVMALKEAAHYSFAPAGDQVSSFKPMVQPIIAAGYKKVAMVRNNVSSTLTDAKESQKLFDAAGVKYAEEEYKIDDVEFSALALRVKGASPDAIYIMGAVVPPAAAFAKAVRELGLKTPIIIQDDLATPDFPKLAGDAAENATVVGVRFPQDPSVQSPAQKALAAAMAAEKPGQSPSRYHGWGWDCVTLLAEGIKNAGSTDPEAIRNAIDRIINFDGATGRLRFTPELRLGLEAPTFYTMVFKGGKLVPR
ncbi:MAG: ABC transporter substrate-binding protein [Chloroflexi bacterium]|nr:ABC transporter substrate-binding protein [Chloroflexota bacterium]